LRCGDFVPCSVRMTHRLSVMPECMLLVTPGMSDVLSLPGCTLGPKCPASVCVGVSISFRRLAARGGLLLGIAYGPTSNPLAFSSSQSV
jgi:hypothetical protein